MKLDESSWKGSEPSQSSSRTHLRVLCWLIAINGAIRTRFNLAASSSNEKGSPRQYHGFSVADELRGSVVLLTGVTGETCSTCRTAGSSQQSDPTSLVLFLLGTGQLHRYFQRCLSCRIPGKPCAGADPADMPRRRQGMYSTAVLYQDRLALSVDACAPSISNTHRCIVWCAPKRARLQRSASGNSSAAPYFACCSMIWRLCKTRCS